MVSRVIEINYLNKGVLPHDCVFNARPNRVFIDYMHALRQILLTIVRFDSFKYIPTYIFTIRVKHTFSPQFTVSVNSFIR